MRICAAKPESPAIQDATATTLRLTSPTRNTAAATTAHPATLVAKHAHPNDCRSMNRTPPFPGCQNDHEHPYPSKHPS